jgi:ATP-binding cassette subfamily B protein
MMRLDPILLVLDEPNASLDPDAEQALFARWAERAERSKTDGAITLLISHRFSTVRIADLIVVLDNHGIREVGTHAELIANQGLYAELYTLQAAAYQ